MLKEVLIKVFEKNKNFLKGEAGNGFSGQDFFPRKIKMMSFVVNGNFVKKLDFEFGFGFYFNLKTLVAMFLEMSTCFVNMVPLQIVSS